MGLFNWLASGLRLIGHGPRSADVEVTPARREIVKRKDVEQREAATEAIDALQRFVASGEVSFLCVPNGCRLSDDKPLRMRHFCGKVAPKPELIRAGSDEEADGWITAHNTGGWRRP